MVIINKYWLCLLILLLFLPASAFSAVKHQQHFALKAAIVVDMDSGKVLFEQQADKLIQPASLSKILALYIANEDLRAGKVHLSDQVRISINAVNTGGSKMLYEEGKAVLYKHPELTMYTYLTSHQSSNPAHKAANMVDLLTTLHIEFWFIFTYHSNFLLSKSCFSYFKIKLYIPINNS